MELALSLESGNVNFPHGEKQPGLCPKRYNVAMIMQEIISGKDFETGGDSRDPGVFRLERQRAI